MKLLSSNISSRILCISFLFFSLCSCSVKKNSTQSAEARLRASAYVSKYGQIIGEAQANYLSSVQTRLSEALNRAGDRKIEFKTILLNSKSPMAFSAGDGFILLSKGLVLSLQKESELAFVMAHEMSHEYLGHNEEVEKQNGTFEQIRDLKTEIAADKMALAILSAAGYDPRYALDALNNSYRFAGNALIIGDASAELTKRKEGITQFIEESGWRPPGTIDRRNFHSFQQDLKN